MKGLGRGLQPAWLSLSLILLLSLALPPPAAYAAPAVQTNTTRTYYISAPEGAASFGAAIDYDGKTLVVGAPATWVEGHHTQGMVYIYALDADDPENWELQASVTLTTPAEYVGLGTSVAVDGDIIVAGAPLHYDMSKDEYGGVLFIERTEDDPAWRPTRYERNVEYSPADQQLLMGAFSDFGESVAIEDAVVLVGAPRADVIHPEHGRLKGLGAVFQFARSEQVGDWSRVGQFFDEEGSITDHFGASVALDLHGDVNYIIAGATRADAQEPKDYQGKALVWKQGADDPAYSLLDEITNPQGQRYGAFGHAVAVHSGTFVVGTPEYEVDDMSRSGIVAIRKDALGQDVQLVKPSDYGTTYRFGQAVATHNEIVVASAPGYPYYDFSGWGAVVRFELGEESWEETGFFTADLIEGGGNLGASVAIYDGLILAGATNAGIGEWHEEIGPSGAVVIFDDRPSTQPQEPVDPELEWLVPENLEPTDGSINLAKATPAQSQAHTLFLPDIVVQYSAPAFPHDPRPDDPQPDDPLPDDPLPDDPLPDDPLPDDPLPAVQVLHNGSYIRSNFGAVLGTVDGTQPEPRMSYIVAVSEPITPLPAALNPVGHYFNFGTVTKTVTAPLDTPLVVGLPVPAGVNPAELAAAVLVPADKGSLHSTEDTWIVQPGAYSAETDLLAFTMPTLYRGGLVVVLVTAPNNRLLEPPVPAATAEASPTQLPTAFDVRCGSQLDPASPYCADQFLEEVAQNFLTAHEDFRALGFRDPALNTLYPVIQAGLSKPEIYKTQLFWGVTVSSAPCQFAGHYHPDTLSIDVCMASASVTDSDRDTIRHELFHAIQFAYPEVMADWEKDIAYLLEGTAVTAERSSSEFAPSTPYAPRTVSKPLHEPYGTNHVLPYEAQDFWIYTGQRLGQTLAYLIPIFEIGGEPEDVNAALGGNLAGTYWEWVKNQVYEKEIVHPGRMRYAPCAVEESLVDLHPFIITAPQGQLTIPNTLDELTAIGYSFSFTGDQEQRLSITVKRAGPKMFYKIYKQGEACDTVADSEDFYTEEINAGDTYIVIVATGSHNTPESYELEVTYGEWGG